MKTGQKGEILRVPESEVGGEESEGGDASLCARYHYQINSSRISAVTTGNTTTPLTSKSLPYHDPHTGGGVKQGRFVVLRFPLFCSPE